MYVHKVSKVKLKIENKLINFLRRENVICQQFCCTYTYVHMHIHKFFPERKHIVISVLTAKQKSNKNKNKYNKITTMTTPLE